MTFLPFDHETPVEIQNARVSQHSLQNFVHQLSNKYIKGLHLVTENTPNGQKVQIFLEELADAYGTEWTTTLL
jgi:glutathione S-transferase